jgi:hypothetical protein
MFFRSVVIVLAEPALTLVCDRLSSDPRSELIAVQLGFELAAAELAGTETVDFGVAGALDAPDDVPGLLELHAATSSNPPPRSRTGTARRAGAKIAWRPAGLVVDLTVTLT